MKQLTLILIFFLVIGCNSSDPQPVDGNWLIPSELVFDGGPGKDGIPALNSPDVQLAGHPDLSYLSDDDLVLLYKNGDEIKAYTHNVLDWHEIINDEIGEDQVAITYCPLTGTGIGWGREINGQVTTFGVSGLLYESNLMPYDRLTDSYWNQMFNQCVKGELINETPEFFNLVQMSYGALKTVYSNALITTSNTGHFREYERYPYGSYKFTGNLLFPISNTDDRVFRKDEVRGVIINGRVKVYEFPAGDDRVLIADTFQGENLIVIADPNLELIVSFAVDDPTAFSLVSDTGAIILEDADGNRYDVFGTVVEGPNEGGQLEIPYSYMGYWFAWATFYPDLEIYTSE